MPQILIVEDDVTLANLYNTIFKRDGFDVLVARDGAEGLQMALTRKPHFILLDMMLPKMTGMEVFEKILADPNAKNIPVIFLSNDTDPSERERALKLGAKDYIAKAKQSPEEIVNRVKKDLGMLAD